MTPAFRRPAIFSGPGMLTSGYFGVMFLSFGAHLPFWPIWLADRGLSAAEIGTYTAAGVAGRVFAGFAAPMLADWTDQRRLTLAIINLCGAAVFISAIWAESAAALFMVTVFGALVFSATTPIADALGIAAARSYGFPFAQARATGSVTFLVTNLILGGLIASTGSWVLLPWLMVTLVAAAPLAILHPGGGRARTGPPLKLSEVGALLRHPIFLLMAAVTALLQGSHAVYYALGSVHWRNIGLGEGEIGALWAFGVAVEAGLMITVGAAMIRRLGPTGALALSGIAGVLRWTAMGFDPTGLALWGLQALHAFSFAAGYLGMIGCLAAAVPSQIQASAQGFAVQVLGNVTMAASMALAGIAYPLLGAGVYGIAAFCSGLGLVLLVILRRVWNGGLVLRASELPA